MLPPVHLRPINVVVYNDPEKKSNLVAGFVLRCFQHLSNPDLDTRQCTYGGTTGKPEVSPTRSSRTSVRATQISYAHDR